MGTNQNTPDPQEAIWQKLAAQVKQKEIELATAKSEIAKLKSACSQLTKERNLALYRITAQNTQIEYLTRQLVVSGQSNERLRSKNTKLQVHATELTNEVTQLKEQNASLLSEYNVLSGQVAQLVSTLGHLGVGPSTPSSAMPFGVGGKNSESQEDDDKKEDEADADKNKDRGKYPKRERSGKKPGGQKGHKGCTASRRTPDKTMTHEPSGICQECGNLLCNGKFLYQTVYQGISLELIIKVIDHIRITRKCCGETHQGTFPKDITSPVCYTNESKSVVLALSSVGLLPINSITSVIQGLSGLKLANGSVASWIRQLAGKLQGFEKAAIAALMSSEVINVDETGIKTMQGGQPRTLYAHVASTPFITLFHLGTRSKESIKSGHIVGNHQGVLVTDCYSSYFSLHKFAHQLCLAHFIRDARWYDEFHTPPTAYSQTPNFAGIARLLQDAIHARNQNPNVVLGYEEYQHELQDLVTEGLLLMKSDTRKVTNPPRNLLQRLQDHQEKLWLFLSNPQVPPTNNGAERPIRPLKVKLKRSGRFRTTKGTKDHLLIASYISTCIKNNIEPVDAIKRALDDDPWLPEYNFTNTTSPYTTQTNTGNSVVV